MNASRLIAGIGWFVLPWLAQAAEPIAVQHVAAYAPGVGATDLRTQCDWNTRLSEYIVKDAKGLAVVSDQDAAAVDGPYLSLTVTSAHAVGGGGFAGPTWAHVHGELHSHGKLVGSFDARNTTRRGWKACSAINIAARDMAEDIADWLHAPTLNATM